MEPLRLQTPDQERLLEQLLRKKGFQRESSGPKAESRPDGRAPQSFAQQRLWFLGKLATGAPAYNICFGLRTRQALVADDLARAFERVTRRHEVLRSVFDEDEAGPFQRVLEECRFELREIDLRASGDTLAERQLVQLLEEAAGRRFDIAQAPPLHATLVRLPNDELALVVALHHIVADGWSMDLLTRDLAASYGSLRTGGDGALPPLPFQYADYSIWERSPLRQPTVERALAYWRSHLADVPPRCAITGDRGSPARLSGVGAALHAMLPGGLSRELRTLAQSRNVTLFMVLLTAFKMLVARRENASDIVIGTPVWNRDREDLEPLIGCFANTVVLRSDLSGAPSFDTALQRVRSVCADAFEHQGLPFERLIAELDLERQQDVPLVQMVFAFDDQAAQGRDGDAVWMPLEMPTRTAKFELSWHLAMTNDGLAMSVDYSVDLYDEATIRGLLAQYERLLRGVAAQPQVPLSQVDLVGERERRWLVQEWGRGGLSQAPAGDVCEWFEARAREAGGAPATAQGQARRSYGELNEAADRLARVLRDRGVGGGAVVAIGMARGIDVAVACLAVWKAGAAFLPLDITHPVERLSYIVQDAQVRWVITAAGLQGAQVVPGLEHVAVDTADAVSDAIAAGRPWVRESNLDDLAYVIYTSGSTGKPKGVEVTHRGLANLVNWQRRHFALGAEDRASQLAGAAFDACMLEWWAPLTAGASVHVADELTRLQAAALLEWLAAQRITMAFLPTPLAEACYAEKWPAGMALRTVLVGGEALRRRPPTAWSCRVYNLYGPTEVTVLATCGEVASAGAGVPDIGAPIDGVQLLVLDEHGALVPTGVAGDLHIGGVGLARGYRGHPELTAQRFSEQQWSGLGKVRLYRTGDRVRVNAQGALEFLGRLDDQVKIRGHRIELGEIEAALCRIQGVVHGAVAVRQAPGGTHFLAGFVELAHGSALNAALLRHILRQQLPDYMVPAVIAPFETLPKTHSGKLDRQALAAAPITLPAGASAPPVTAAQTGIADIWSSVLEQPVTDVHANFFLLGGNSLLATRVLSRMAGTLQVHRSLVEFFADPTIAGLAGSAEEAPGAQPSPVDAPITRLVRNPEQPLVVQQSFAQQRLWFLEQLAPGGDAYHVPSAWRVRGDLDVGVLRESMRRLVLRHESLRTNFDLIVSGATTGNVQRVALEPRFGWSFSDLAPLPEDERTRRAQRLVANVIRRPFDLGHDSPMTVTVVKLAERDHVLVVNLHHLITDGWSMAVFFRELTEIYGALAERRDPQLPEAIIQYADYAEWQREWMQFGALEELLYYWTDKLKGAPPRVAFAAESAGTAPDDAAGHAVFKLDATLVAPLRSLALLQRASLFMVLLAAFKGLLARYTGQTDIVVGTAVANRNREELESLIGFFVNTLALRTDLSGDPSFIDALSRVRETTLGAFAHQELPFERLVNRFDPQRRWDRLPLFNVMFVLQNAPSGDLSLPGLEVAPIGLPGGAAKFDLTVSLQESRDGGVEGVFEYSNSVLRETDVTSLLAQYERLLRGVAAQPQVPLSQVDLVGERERRWLVQEWGRGGLSQAPAGDVCEWFEARAREAGGAPATAQGQARRSYGELNEAADRLARVLRDRGVGGGAVVAIGMARGIDVAVACLAVWKAGAAFLPLDITHPVERLSYIVQDAQVRWVITAAGLQGAQVVPGLEHVAVDTADAVSDAIAAGRPWVRESNLDDLAYVIYTSGSTGKPKGVEVTHRGLANLVNWQRRHFALGAEDRASQLAGAAFDACMLEWWAPLTAGASVHVADELTRLQAAALLEWLAAQRITMAFLPTPLAEACYAEKWPAGMALRTVLVGGEALRRRPPTAWSCRVYNLYGPTEVTVLATCGEVASAGAGVPDIGAPIDGVQLLVLDEHGALVPTGVAGDLHIGGVGLARGYRGHPELTAQRFSEQQWSGLGKVRLYRTGDRVRVNAQGALEFLGRLDDQVKIRGHRIELGEIEAALMDQPEVTLAKVVMLRAADDPVMAAYVSTRTDEAAAECELRLREGLERRLPSYMVPATIDRLVDMPFTRNGKIDVTALPVPLPRLRARNAPATAPADELERAVAVIWGELLGYSPVGMHDAFFNSGGHSLLAVHFKSAVQRRFEADIPLTVFLEDATPARLTAQIRRIQGAARPVDATSLDRRDGGTVRRRRDSFGGVVRRTVDWLGKRRRRTVIGPQDVLVRLNQANQGDPIFFIHPVGGNVLCYGRLAQLLGAGQPLYGLKAPANLAALAPTLEAMAQWYVAAIRTVQPQGPIRLCGWSMGGLIALEMAQQLRRERRDTERLIMIDSQPKQGGDREGVRSEAELQQMFRADVAAGRSDDAQGPDARQATDSLMDEQWPVFRAAYDAWCLYKPQPYDRQLRLIMAVESVKDDEFDLMRAWAPIAGGGLSIDVVPGDHYTLLRDEGSLAVIAQHLRHLLAGG